MALSVFNNIEVDAFSLQNPIRRYLMKSVRFMLAITIVCSGSIFVNVQEADAGVFSSRRGGFRIFKRSCCKARITRSNRCSPCDTNARVDSAPANIVATPAQNPIDLVPKALIAPPIVQEESKPPAPVVKPHVPVVKPPVPVVKAETKPKVEETLDEPFTLAPTKREKVEKVDKVDTFEYPLLPKIEVTPNSDNLSPFVTPEINNSWLKL